MSDPMKTICSTPCVEYPDLMKVALHTGPDCDPDTRSLVPGYDDCEGYLSPFGTRVVSSSRVYRYIVYEKAVV